MVSVSARAAFLVCMASTPLASCAGGSARLAPVEGAERSEPVEKKAPAKKNLSLDKGFVGVICADDLKTQEDGDDGVIAQSLRFGIDQSRVVVGVSAQEEGGKIPPAAAANRECFFTSFTSHARVGADPTPGNADFTKALAIECEHSEREEPAFTLIDGAFVVTDSGGDTADKTIISLSGSFLIPAMQGEVCHVRVATNDDKLRDIMQPKFGIESAF